MTTNPESLAPRSHAEVTVTVKVGDQTKTFTADTTTTGDPHRAANQLLGALRFDADCWLDEARRLIQ